MKGFSKTLAKNMASQDLEFTFPLRSPKSFSVNVGFGGQDWSMKVATRLMVNLTAINPLPAIKEAWDDRLYTSLIIFSPRDV